MENLELNNIMNEFLKNSVYEPNSKMEVTEEIMADNFPNSAKYIKPTDTRI